MRLFDKWFRKSEISRADSKCHAYRFGRIDWAKSIDKSLLRIDNATEYMIRVLDMLDGLYGLAGKNVADIGGSNISKEMADHYHIKKFVCVDPVTQWYQDCGYDISKTRYANLHLVKNDDFSDAWRKHDYFIVDEPAEKLDAQYHNKFDIIVSMSTFEHVDSITNTMDNVHAMLIPGGYFMLPMSRCSAARKGIIYGSMKICALRSCRSSIFCI